MRVLVTGASGFAGSLLVPRLHREGYDLRAMARDRTRLRIPRAWNVETVSADVVSGEGLERALEGIEVAYYLIHSMERLSAGDFPARERRAAENFAGAASRAGVARIVYLGGPFPRTPETDTEISPHPAGGLPSHPTGRPSPHLASRLSPHLASRLAVEEILLTAIPNSVALRASIVVGARSRSFRFMVRLVERLPVLALPSWQRFRTQPIDARDVVAMLSAAAREPSVAGRSLDIGGPDVLSYGAMLQRIAELMVVGRPTMGLGVSLTGVTARVAAAIAAEDPEFVLPLMESLSSDLLFANAHRTAALLGVRLHSFDAAVEHALGEWEATEKLAAR